MNVEDVNIVEEQRSVINELRQTVADLKAENKLLKDMLTVTGIKVADESLPKNTRVSDI